MWKVSITINGEQVEINAVRVFPSRNPATNRHNVNFILSGSKKGVRLFCQDREDAATLAKKVREGEITDLTDYPAEWNL